MKIAKENIKKILIDYFKTRPEIIVSYIFGSYSRNNINPLSDIDIAVLLDENLIQNDSLEYRSRLIADVMSVLKTNLIDVVILNQAGPLLTNRIIRDGIIIKNNDDSKRVRFEVRALQKYIDTKPLRNIQKKYFKQKIMEYKNG